MEKVLKKENKESIEVSSFPPLRSVSRQPASFSVTLMSHRGSVFVCFSPEVPMEEALLKTMRGQLRCERTPVSLKAAGRVTTAPGFLFSALG